MGRRISLPYNTFQHWGLFAKIPAEELQKIQVKSDQKKHFRWEGQVHQSPSQHIPALGPICQNSGRRTAKKYR